MKMVWPGRALGVALLVPALLSLVLFIREEVLPLVLAIDGIVSFVALIDLASLVGAGRLRVERQVGRVCSLNEHQDVVLSIENVGRRARSLRLRDDVPDEFSADPAAFDVTVPSRRQASLTYRFVPKRRGTYVFQQVDALVDSRLGFWRGQYSWPLRTEVRVYPNIHQVARFTMLARRDRLSTMGLRRSRRLGTDNEFERLRDYIEGDDPRHLDWRATARRRKLTCRAFQANQSQRIMFLIDCGRLMAGDTGDGLSPLDHAFNAMLLLAHVALIRGDQVGMLAFSDRVCAYVAPGGGPRRINRLVHGVHNIFPEMVEPRYDRAFIELEQRCRKRSLVVLMTNLFDELSAELAGEYLRNLSGRHLPLGVFLRDHDLFAMADRAAAGGAGLYQGAAAASLLNWRERVLAGLRMSGVLTLDVFPEELTAVLVNRYIEIKARHLL
ncbi:MAG TPA: DUF58 domain-containing protein [Isosphaeraceae bacterium]|nr:DUF58 domain-containing protein [Isosphaeraceae bacterium]